MPVSDVVGPFSDVRPLFAEVRSSLLVLLGELAPGEWMKSTAAAPWTVRDVVAHLLGDDVSRLSRSRDGHESAGPSASQTLADFLHPFNEQWVQAAGRMSPPVMVSLLEVTSAQVLAFWGESDLHAGGGPVTWAGSGPAPVWLDCARDFTEDWVHQQQIRDATGRAGGDAAAVVHGVLDTFLRAMPLTLSRHAAGAADDSTLSVEVSGDGGGRWSWRRTGGAWYWDEPVADPSARISTDPATLWRLCVRMIEPAEAASRASVEGDPRLAQAALQIVSIIR